jgi:hypothetical protein
MKVIKAPQSFENELANYKSSVFLAGSIEMGKAVDWQKKIEYALQKENVLILNPRRDDWDSSWEQNIENKQFREQVEWELKAQEKAKMIVMYFSPETKAPITLLELGLFAKSNKIIVCCPEGFYRKGNVDIVCKRYDVPMVSDIDGLVYAVKHSIL